MSASILWHNCMPTVYPRVTGALPKKPVMWSGEVFLQMPDGERDTRQWRSNHPITCDQARSVLVRLLEMLIGEHGKDAAVHSGLSCKSR